MWWLENSVWLFGQVPYVVVVFLCDHYYGGLQLFLIGHLCVVVVASGGVCVVVDCNLVAGGVFRCLVVANGSVRGGEPIGGG